MEENTSKISTIGAVSAQAENKGNSTGLTNQEKMSALFAYLFAWLGGAILLFTEKKSDYVRYHAAQSVIFYGALTVLLMIPLPGFIYQLLNIVFPLSWLFLMFKAYTGSRLKIPVVGDFAEKLKEAVGK